jgi:hypothetical protein
MVLLRPEDHQLLLGSQQVLAVHCDTVAVAVVGGAGVFGGEAGWQAGE